MIEVTQKNKKGVVEILAQYETEEDFGKAHWPLDILDDFSTSPIMVGVQQVYLPSISYYITEPVFKKVAYNGKGKVLTPDHLLGLARKYNPRYNRYWGKYSSLWFTGSKSNWHRGVNIRYMKTTQEYRWEKAWDDEEFAPKYRAKRTHKYLPNVYDDYWRYNMKSWKQFRKHQWKD